MRSAIKHFHPIFWWIFCAVNFNLFEFVSQPTWCCRDECVSQGPGYLQGLHLLAVSSSAAIVVRIWRPSAQLGVLVSLSTPLWFNPRLQWSHALSSWRRVLPCSVPWLCFNFFGFWILRKYCCSSFQIRLSHLESCCSPKIYSRGILEWCAFRSLGYFIHCHKCLNRRDRI